MRPKRSGIRNFEIYPDISKTGGIPSIEIGPGRYSGDPAREGSIFINEDSFVVIEELIKRHFKKYIHEEINNISRTKGRTIIAELRDASESVKACNGKDILGVTGYTIDRSPKTVNELIRCKGKISLMLAGLADFMERVYDVDDWIFMVRV